MLALKLQKIMQNQQSILKVVQSRYSIFWVLYDFC